LICHLQDPANIFITPTEQLGEYEAAAEDCKKSIELEPTYEKAHTRLGLSLFFQGDCEGAIDAYEKLLDLEPTNEAWFNYIAKVKERLTAQLRDESVEMESLSA